MFSHGSTPVSPQFDAPAALEQPLDGARVAGGDADRVVATQRARLHAAGRGWRTARTGRGRRRTRTPAAVEQLRPGRRRLGDRLRNDLGVLCSGSTVLAAELRRGRQSAFRVPPSARPGSRWVGHRAAGAERFEVSGRSPATPVAWVRAFASASGDQPAAVAPGSASARRLTINSPASPAARGARYDRLRLAPSVRTRLTTPRSGPSSGLRGSSSGGPPRPRRRRAGPVACRPGQDSSDVARSRRTRSAVPDPGPSRWSTPGAPRPRRTVS